MNHKITDKYTLVTPDGYEKESIPFFEEWYEDLKKNPAKHCSTLSNDDNTAHCCLGAVIVQGRGRVDNSGRLYDTPSRSRDKVYGVLSNSNPFIPFMGRTGRFPEGVFLTENGDEKLCLSNVNDGTSLEHKDIAEIINIVWKR